MAISTADSGSHNICYVYPADFPPDSAVTRWRNFPKNRPLYNMSGRGGCPTQRLSHTRGGGCGGGGCYNRRGAGLPRAGRAGWARQPSPSGGGFLHPALDPPPSYTAAQLHPAAGFGRVSTSAAALNIIRRLRNQTTGITDFGQNVGQKMAQFRRQPDPPPIIRKCYVYCYKIAQKLRRNTIIIRRPATSGGGFRAGFTAARGLRAGFHRGAGVEGGFLHPALDPPPSYTAAQLHPAAGFTAARGLRAGVSGVEGGFLYPPPPAISSGGWFPPPGLFRRGFRAAATSGAEGGFHRGTGVEGGGFGG